MLLCRRHMPEATTAWAALPVEKFFRAAPTWRAG